MCTRVRAEAYCLAPCIAAFAGQPHFHPWLSELQHPSYSRPSASFWGTVCSLPQCFALLVWTAVGLWTSSLLLWHTSFASICMHALYAHCLAVVNCFLQCVLECVKQLPRSSMVLNGSEFHHGNPRGVCWGASASVRTPAGRFSASSCCR